MSHDTASERNADSLNKNLSPIVDPKLVRSTTFGDSLHSNNGEHCMTTTFDFASLQTSAVEKKTADFAEYQMLLREIAADKCKRSKEEILAILKDVERDVQMLEEDVRKRAERDKMIAELDRVAELQAQSDELTTKAKALREEFEKVENEYRNKRNPIIWKRDHLDETIREIEGYRDRLLESCDDVNLIYEREEARSRLHNPTEDMLYENQRRLADEMETVERALHNLPLSCHQAEEKRELKARLKKMQARYEEGELKKLDFKKQEEKQKAVIREIEERMIRS